MIKITVQHENSDSLVLQIKGRFVEPCSEQVPEELSQQLASNGSPLFLGARTLAIDISGVTFMDESSKRTLATLFNITHGVVLATTPLTRDFANDIHIMQQEG